MAKITFSVNNGDIQVWEQNEHGGSVALYTGVDGREARENKTTIPPGDMVMLANLYRYIKEKNIRNSWVNPGGTKVVDDDDDVLFAMKKQIPQKPIKDREQHMRFTSSYSCPSCGGGFTGTGIANYCYHCGQALDWGDEV